MTFGTPLCYIEVQILGSLIHFHDSALSEFCICTLKVLSFSVVSSQYLQWFLIPFLFSFCISPSYMDTAYNTKQYRHQPNDQYWMYTIYDLKKSTSLEWYSIFNICTHCTIQIIRTSPHFIICVWVGSFVSHWHLQKVNMENGSFSNELTNQLITLRPLIVQCMADEWDFFASNHQIIRV